MSPPFTKILLIETEKYDKIRHKIYGDKNMVYDIIIVGGGASGLAAAINAKRTNGKIKVAILEALPRVGKKILATGNGRCNLTNFNAVSSCYTNSAFTQNVLESYPSRKVLEFFKSLGVLCVNDGEGRVYPMSNTAASVLDALRYEAERLGVGIYCDTHVEKIKRNNGVFDVDGKIGKRVIIAVGGCSSPSQGSDGSGYSLLKSLGHTVTEVYPGLVRLNTEENTKALKGIRVKARLKLLRNGEKIDSSKGEVLFTESGISGIAAMDISRSIKKGKYICVLDVLPECDEKAVRSFLNSLNGEMPIENALSGMLPRRVGQYILKKCGINFTVPIKKLKENEIGSIISTAKALRFNISGTDGFANAQITIGGARIDEFDPKTLQSRLVKGLYCTGELLDVDGICGGYNLQWAWASGLTAGRLAAEGLLKK